MQSLLIGCILLPLDPKPDRRGWLLEAFRTSWLPDIPCSQINLMWSRAGTLRGSHVHGVHVDCFVMASGECLIGLKDVRDRSPTFARLSMLQLSCEVPNLIVVPASVVHGLNFPVDSILLTVESDFYDPSEEIPCRWDDKELGIPWPFTTPILSDKDAQAQSYREMMTMIEP
jgi:dTDP-4-dehydrorhamnose 3,5-epimerase